MIAKLEDDSIIVEFSNVSLPGPPGEDGILINPDTSQVSVPTERIIGSPTEALTLDKIIDYTWSAGLFNDASFFWTDLGNGSVFIGNGEGLLRSSASETAPLQWVSVPGKTLELFNNSVNYFYVDHNGGLPEIKVTVDVNDFNCLDKCIIYRGSRVDTDIQRIGAGANNVDANRKSRRKSLDLENIRITPGTALTADKGSRYFGVTTGSFWFVLSNLKTPEYDTTGIDKFSIFYGSGITWIENTDNSQISNLLYNDGTVVPATLGVGRASAHFVFMSLDEGAPHLSVISAGSYKTPADAMSADVPAVLPPELGAVGVYIATIIIEQGAAEIDTILTHGLGSTQGVVQTTHNSLPGLQGGLKAERNHFNLADYISLTAQAAELAVGGSPVFAQLTGINGKLFFGADSVYDGVNNRLGINETTPLARLHAKGSTSDSSAFVMKLDDSSGSRLVDVRNDGATQFWGGRIYGATNASQLLLNNSIGASLFYTLGLRVTSNSNGANIGTKLNVLHNGNVGIGQTSPTARTHIKGETSDDTAYALKVDDSSGGSLFSVRNDGVSSFTGQVTFGGKILTNGPRSKSYLIKNATYQITYSDPEIIYGNTGTSSFSINLPTSPENGDVRTVKNTGASLNDLTIGRSSELINGVALDLVLSDNIEKTLHYTTDGWQTL